MQPPLLSHATTCLKHCEWLTPTHIIERAIQVMGHIDLDPCSNSKTEPHVPARYHYIAEDDGLSKTWNGTVFLNPPWSRKEGIALAPWIEKLHRSYQQGTVTEAVALLPAYTDLAWFHDFCIEYPICLLRGRVNFSHGTKRPPFASLILYLGQALGRFIQGFSDLGRIYIPWAG